MVKAPIISINFCCYLITYGSGFIFTEKNIFQGMNFKSENTFKSMTQVQYQSLRSSTLNFKAERDLYPR